jgi:hypothetical protein
MTSQTVSGAVSVVAHTVNRLEIRSPATYDELRARYEQAVPVFEPSLLEGAASWDEVLRRTAAVATNGFLLYGKLDAAPLMRLNGHSARSTTYLMGNHIIAETMYGHNAGVMLYAPLRTVIFEDAEGVTCFAIDQPSTRFGSFGDEAVAATGRLLDAKLATLLEVVGMPVPAGLNAGG